MNLVKQVTTITVEMSSKEYEALRLLSERVRNAEHYVCGENWQHWMSEIIGDDYAETIANLIKRNDD